MPKRLTSVDLAMYRVLKNPCKRVMGTRFDARNCISDLVPGEVMPLILQGMRFFEKMYLLPEND
jgi:hypothetical protein